MNKLNLCILLCILSFGVLSANAQSGSAGLEVYVKCGTIGNDGCSVSNAKVTLRPIEAWDKSTETFEMRVDADSGYYSAEVSFGEYELVIAATGFETYRTTVYIPSSNNLKWSVRLHSPTITSVIFMRHRYFSAVHSDTTPLPKRLIRHSSLRFKDTPIF